MRRLHHVSLLAVLITSIAACHVGEPLQVTHATPSGEVDALPTWFEVHFDKPIIDPDAQDPQAKGLSIELEPPLAGRVSFPTASSIAFSFSDEMPPAQRVQVRIAAGLRSFDGAAVLKRAHAFSFVSRGNAGTALYRLPAAALAEEGGEIPETGERHVEVLDLSDKLLLTLRHPARVDQLRRLLRVSGEPLDGGAASDVPVSLVFPPGETADRVVIAPKESWTKATRLRVVIGRGLGVAEPRAGSATTSADQTLSAATYGPLMVVRGPVCEGCTPPPTLVFELSTPVDCSAAMSQVTLDPPVERMGCAGASPSRTLRLEPSPQLRANTKYTVTVAAGLRDMFGQALAAPVTYEIVTGDDKPRFAYQTMFNVLERAQRPVHEEKVYKAAKLRVEGARLAFAQAWSIIADQALGDQVAWRELPWWLAESYDYYEGDCYWDEEQGTEVCDQTNRNRQPGAVSAGLTIPNATTRELPLSTPEGWSDVQVELDPYLGGKGGVLVLQQTAVDAKGKGLGAPVLRLLNVTDIGLSAKYSPTQLVVLAARLSDGKPIAGAKVAVYAVSKSAAELGAPAVEVTTDEQGLAVVRAAQVAREGAAPDLQAQSLFITASTDDDEAFVWSKFESGGSRAQAGVGLVGKVYTERGIYRPGETVYFRVVARRSSTDGFTTPTGEVRVTAGLPENPWDDDETDVVFDQNLVFSKYGTVHGSFVVPPGARVGDYRLRATIGGVDLVGQLKVGEFRRAEMKVTVRTDRADYVSGDVLRGSVNADYLFGAPAAGLQARLTLRRAWGSFDSQRFPQASFTDSGSHYWYDGSSEHSTFLDEGLVKLDANGAFAFERTLQSAANSGRLETLIIGATVDDASGQSVSATTRLRVHPADLHVGLVGRGYLKEVGKLFSFDAVAVDLADDAAAGVELRVSAHQDVWHSVQRRGPGGRMYWEYQRGTLDTPDLCRGKTDARGVLACQFTPAKGGSLRLRVEATDSRGRVVRASTWFWVVGDPDYYGSRSDSGNEVGLIPEARELEAGQTARVVLTSPFKEGLALVTVEREDVLWRRVMPVGTNGLVEIPVPPEWAPNVYLSATIVRGRVAPEGGLEPDPERDKPAYALGYVKLDVKPTRNVLGVLVQTDRDVYEPGERVSASVATTDWSGKPAAAEVNLYAVDEGVLMLTAYQTPDLIPSLFTHRPYAVLALDTRMHVLGRRKLVTPVIKGEEDGGGGGESEAVELRKDFNPVATWVGSLVTDAQGKATHAFTVPDTLTTYRLMAVAVGEASLFGKAEASFKVNKTLMMRQAMPRFLRPGDRVQAGVVVNQLTGGDEPVTVQLEGLDESLFTLRGERKLTQQVPGKGTVAFRFDLEAKDAEGAAQIVFSASMGKYRDRVQLELPVRRLQPRESVGFSGVLEPGEVRHTLALPEGARPVAFDVNMSALPVASLEERMRELVGYPYGCLEQRTSKVLPLIAVRELAEKLGFASIPSEKIKGWVTEWVSLVPKYRCPDDGFDYYPGCHSGSDPYLTAFALDGLVTARRYGYGVPDTLIDPAARYLEARLASMSGNRSSWDGNSAGLAGALRVLAQLQRSKPAQETVLYEGRAGLPLFAKTDLARAIYARTGKSDGMVSTLLGEITANAITAGSSITFPAADRNAYWWAWDSSRRSTALVLRTLLEVAPADARVPLVVRGLVDLGKEQTYYDTQGTTQTLLALAEAANLLRAENQTPIAAVKLAGKELARDRRVGQKVEVVKAPAEVLTSVGPYELQLGNGGKGPLYFGAFFSYAYPATARLPAMQQGFRVTRKYSDRDGRPLGKSVRVGDYVRVDLEIWAQEAGRMVVVDDPLPAGLEPIDTSLATADAEMEKITQPGGGRDWSWWRSRYRELRDDRVEWHFRQIYQSSDRWPIRLTYLTRATTAGTYYAPGTAVERMYQPEVRGRAEGRELEVLPRQE